MIRKGGEIGYSMEKVNERVLQIDMEIKNLEDHLEQQRSEIVSQCNKAKSVRI